MKDYSCARDCLPRCPLLFVWTAFALLLLCVLSHPSAAQPLLTERHLSLYLEPSPSCPPGHLGEQPWHSNLSGHFADLLQEAGLLTRLQLELEKHGALTVFVPSDEALAQLESVVSSLQTGESAEIAAKILLFHFVPQFIREEDLATGDTVCFSTLARQPLCLCRRRRRIYILDDARGSGKPVAVSDAITAKQVHVHSIDVLLLPKSVRPTICAALPCPLAPQHVGRKRSLADIGFNVEALASAPSEPSSVNMTIGEAALQALRTRTPDRFAPFLAVTRRLGFAAELAAYDGTFLTVLAFSRGAMKAARAGFTFTNETLRYHLLPQYITVDEIRGIIPLAVGTLDNNLTVKFNATWDQARVTVNGAWVLRQIEMQSPANGWKPLSIIGISQVLIPPPLANATVPGPAMAPGGGDRPGLPPSYAPDGANDGSRILRMFDCEDCGRYSSFRDILNNSNLAGDLSLFRQPLTILVPSNAAFQKLSPAARGMLKGTANYTAEMFLMVLGNAVTGYYTLANLASMVPRPTSLPTLQGQNMSVNVTPAATAGMSVRIGGALVQEQIFADGRTSILGIDSVSDGLANTIQEQVMEPSSSQQQASDLLVETLQAAGNYSRLLKLLLDPPDGMDMITNLERFSRLRPFTILAPTDAAFDAMPRASRSYLARNGDTMGKVLRLHMILNYYTAPLLMGLAPYNCSTLLPNHTVLVTVREDGDAGKLLVFNDEAVSSPKPLLSDGRYYIMSIDHVLVPLDLFPEAVTAAPSPGHRSKAKFIWPVIGVVAGIVMVMLIACFFFVLLRRRQQKIEFSVQRDEEPSSQNTLTPATATQATTKRFSILTV